MLQVLVTGKSANNSSHTPHGPLSRYVKLRVAHAPGMPRTFSPPPRVSYPDMHQGTCVNAWRHRYLMVSFEFGGEGNIPGACATRNFTYLVRSPWVNELTVNTEWRAWLYRTRHHSFLVALEALGECTSQTANAIYVWSMRMCLLPLPLEQLEDKM